MTTDDTNNPAVKSGERPLSMFVSSVMTPDMQWARDETIRTLDCTPYLARWAFEYTPASSDAADDSYLAKVREADVVIWLIGEKTTKPVCNEIHEALASNRKLWVFKLPVPGYAQETQDLMREVGLRAKWVNVPKKEGLPELIDLTGQDEIIRAMRNTPGMGRLALLEEMGRASRARCIERWQAVGLSRAEACNLADDSSVGDPVATLGETVKEPVCVVVGGFGSGKSLIAERLIQKAIPDLLT